MALRGLIKADERPDLSMNQSSQSGQSESDEFEIIAADLRGDVFLCLMFDLY